MTIKKARMIEKVIATGSVWKSAYGYVVNDQGAIEKSYNGSSKREVYATPEEVEQVKRTMALRNY